LPSTDRRVEIKELGAKTSKPWIVVGVPEVGLVGTIASSYLAEQLHLEQHGYIDSDLAPQVMVVRDSVPNYPIRILGRHDLIVVTSDVPLPPRFSLELAKELSRWARSKEARAVVGLSGDPSRKREESQGEEKPTVLGITNNGKLLKSLSAAGALPLEQGLVTGFYASLLKYCSLNDQTNLTLLGESMLQFPDPAAAASVIEVLGKLITVKVDTKPLLKESEEIRMRTRELMAQTQEATEQKSGGVPPSSSAYR